MRKEQQHFGETGNTSPSQDAYHILRTSGHHILWMWHGEKGMMNTALISLAREAEHESERKSHKIQHPSLSVEESV